MLCQWILEVWDAIPSELIVRRLKKTRTLNSLDGTGDDALWADDDQEFRTCFHSKVRF